MRSQNEALLLDKSERRWDLESERSDIYVLPSPSKVKLKRLQARPFSVFLKPLERAAEETLIVSCPLIGRC